MFIIKKIFPSSKSKVSSSDSNGCIQSDALPVQKNTSNELSVNSCSAASDIAGSTFGTENNTMNLNNVNQQVVVQFSNINGLQVGSTYNINCSNNSDTKNNHEKFQHGKFKYSKTITIQTMMNSDEEPNREILNQVAMHLGSDYKNFMRELGFSDGQISAKIIDHSVYGVKEVIYQLLLDWVRNADEDGTIGYLTTKLWNSGHRECVYRLKSFWKSKAIGTTNIEAD